MLVDTIGFRAEGIRRMQEITGLADSDFADLVGVTRMTVWRWHSGRCSVSRMATEMIRRNVEPLLVAASDQKGK